MDNWRAGCGLGMNNDTRWKDRSKRFTFQIFRRQCLPFHDMRGQSLVHVWMLTGRQEVQQVLVYKIGLKHTKCHRVKRVKVPACVNTWLRSGCRFSMCEYCWINRLDFKSTTKTNMWMFVETRCTVLEVFYGFHRVGCERKTACRASKFSHLTQED